MPSPILPVLAAATMASHRFAHPVIGENEFKFHLGQEIHGVFATTVDFRMALLATEAFHFRDGHALDSDFGERLLHILHLEWLNDGFDFFMAAIASG